ELIWVSDSGEAQQEMIRPTQLWDRWIGRSSGVSPFGVGFRPAGSSSETPFPSWSYRPAYLPEGWSIEMATGLSLTEPLLFYMPQAVRSRIGSVDHPAGIAEIVRLEISGPFQNSMSHVLKTVVSTGFVLVRNASEYCINVLFHGSRNSILD